jgi:hypothetical protein
MTSASRVSRGPLLAAVLLFLLMTAVMVMRFARDYPHRGPDVYSGDYLAAYKDAGIWYDVGRQVLAGQPVGRNDYRYPPTFAVLVSPLTALPSTVYYFLWYLLNAALFVVAVRLARQLAWPAGESPPSRLLWLPVALAVPYAADNLLLGQANLLMTALIYWSLLELARGREWRAGAILGASVALKVFTFPLLAYLLFRRRWGAVAAVLLSTLFFLLAAPAPFRGPTRNLREVTTWGQRVVEPYLTEGKAGDWGQHAIDYGNQSLQGVLNRLLTHTDANVLARKRRPMYVNLADLPPGTVNLLVGLSFLGLAAWAAWACGWRAPRGWRPVAAESSLAVIFLLLVSALSWTYFFVMMLLPITVCLALLYRSEGLRAGTRRMLTVAIWAQGIALLSLASPLARAAGAICWAAVIAYLALGLACRELRRVEATG